MRTLMQLTVPGTNSAGRLRLIPWRDMYPISPLNPARSQSRKKASSADRSILVTPKPVNPISSAQRRREADRVERSRSATGCAEAFMS